MFRKILSGGQTGVDRAALDVALELGMPCGGWCPKGRRAEDGAIPERYPLVETGSAAYPPRTRRNVRDADATLALTRGAPTGGTALTVRRAQELGKPCYVADLTRHPDAGAVRAWTRAESIGVLNVAGPRESEAPGIYAEALAFLRQVLVSSGPEDERAA
jgi:hypothetical protein